jgi:uncharacterized protein (UPF0261 family)
MVNFGPMESVPARFQGRKFYKHNPQVTLMRTTREENAQFGEWIAKRLNACEGAVRLLVPEKGVSALDAPDMPFHDPIADRALFDALEKSLIRTANRQLIFAPFHINDQQFALSLASNFREVLG